MLHDPRHDKTPSLSGFALFVASKDPNERYEYSNCWECAVGQYLKSIDAAKPYHEWTGDVKTADTLALQGGFGQHTFGQLADRILAHQMAS